MIAGPVLFANAIFFANKKSGKQLVIHNKR